MTVTLSDVRAAAAALAGSIVATPCTLSRTLSELTGARVTIKFENLQFTASFKERGALVKLKNLTATAAQRGVIAVSAGNHGHPGHDRDAARHGVHEGQAHQGIWRRSGARGGDAARRR